MDGAYVVTLPEFPGTHTHGETYAEAVANGEEALRLLVEDYAQRGVPMPTPRAFVAQGV